MSNTEKSLVPHRRFKEFENAGAWERYKLGEHVELITKGTTPRDKSGQGEINFVKVENLSNGEITSFSHISRAEHEGYLKRSQLKVHDILFSIAGTLGRIAIVSPTLLPANTNQALAIIRGYDFDSSFLIATLAGHFVKDYISKNPTVGAQPNLSLKQVFELEINAPGLEEQRKVGLFFSSINKNIALHQRKLNKLKRLKSAYLTEMFPAEGERKPKRRFAGFTDDWEQHKLGELGNITTGNTPKTSENNYWSTSGFIWITPSDIKSSTISDSIKHLSNLGWEKARKVPAYSLLVTCIASIGKNIINVVPAAFNQQINALVPVDNDVYFLLSLINQESSRLSSIAGQTATAIINKKTFEKFDVVVPKLQEQKKMGKLFSKLDNLIALHQRKLNKLKKLKLAYLNEMFV